VGLVVANLLGRDRRLKPRRNKCLRAVMTDQPTIQSSHERALQSFGGMSTRRHEEFFGAAQALQKMLFHCRWPAGRV
jgi:hypothetical protein